MQEERLKILFQYLEEEPNEPFNVYAIAMEYMSKDIQKAKFYLEKLLTEHPDYVPTYYHAAAVYVELEDYTLPLYNLLTQHILPQQYMLS